MNRDVALLFLALNAVGVAVQCASMLPLVSAMLMGGPAGGLPSFEGTQAESLVLLSVSVYKLGFVAAQLFFGTWLFPLGYLVFRSGLLPRVLGILLILDGIAEVVWFLQAFLLTDYPAIRVPGTYVSLVAEVGLALWLLVRGIRVPRIAPAAVVPPTSDAAGTSEGPSA